MFPIIISSLLSTKGKVSKIIFPLKLVILLFLLIIFSIIQIGGKIVKRGENGSSDKSIPFISASIQNAQAVMACTTDGGTTNCGMPAPVTTADGTTAPVTTADGTTAPDCACITDCACTTDCCITDCNCLPQPPSVEVKVE